MHRTLPFSLIALALYGAGSLAHAIGHNDVDGDGKSDLLWRNASTGALVYWPAGNSAKAVTIKVSSTYHTPGDFNLARSTPAFAYSGWSSSTSDLLVENGRGDLIAMMRQSAPGSYHAYEDSFVSTDWDLIGAGNFNVDYYEGDFVFRNRRDGRNMIGFMNWDGRLFTAIASLSDPAWTIAGIGDFDGDGVSDLLWRNQAGGQNAVWRSANASTKLKVASLGIEWKVATIGDFDGDGRSDIFWRNTHSGANVLWKAANSLASQALYTVSDQGWQVVATGDFNGDRKWDVIWRYAPTGANVLWKSANRDTRQNLTTLVPGWNAVM